MTCKRKLGTLVLSFSLILLFMNFSFVSADNILTIVFNDIDWPPTHYSGDDYTSFYMLISFNITNDGETVYIVTPHSNLLYPHMIVDVKGLYATYEGTGGLCMVTNHTIGSGISRSSVGMTVSIPDYNDSKVPPGTITLWAEFHSGPLPYDVRSYNTTLYIRNDGSVTTSMTDYVAISRSILIGCLTLVTIVLLRKKVNTRIV